MKTFAFTALATLAFGVTAAGAHEYTIGDLTIDHPVSYETAVTAQTGAGYLMITNSGDTDDRLLEARADFPRVEVHEIVEVDDVMSMQELEQGLVIPAGGMVMLEPGGYHVMFMGLPAPFEVGDKIPVTLVFENAGELEVVFNVESRTEDAAEHGDHEMEHSDTEEHSE